MVFADDAHTPVEVTWLVYQQIITAYAHADPREGNDVPGVPGTHRVDARGEVAGDVGAIHDVPWVISR